MSDEGEKTCPLCAEEMDLTDQQLKPCKCGYEICIWCWHHIMDMAEKEDTEGRCPACRAPYDKEKIVGMAANCERLVSEINMERKMKSQKAKTKSSEVRKQQLSSVRVIQRNLVYIVGLPLNLGDEELLQHREYFGQYGKVLKVSMSRTAAGVIQQFPNNTCSVYITYSKEEEAIRCIQSIHGFVLEGKSLKACFGTTKYCHAWLRNVPCTNPDCLYLHEIGSQEDSFTKDEIISAHTRSRVQQITGTTSNVQRRSGNVLPPPFDDYCHSTVPTAKPTVKNASNNTASITKDSTPNGSSGRSVSLPAAASWGMRASNQQPLAASACSNGPSKQKPDTVGGVLAFSSAVANSSPASALHGDGAKKPTLNEDSQNIYSKGKSNSLRPLKQYVATSNGEPTTVSFSSEASSLPVTKYIDKGLSIPANIVNSLDNIEDSCVSGPEEEGHVATYVKMQNLCTDMSVMSIDTNVVNEHSGVIRSGGSLPDHCMIKLPRGQGLQQYYVDQSREPLTSPVVGKPTTSAMSIDTNVVNEHSGVIRSGSSLPDHCMIKSPRGQGLQQYYVDQSREPLTSPVVGKPTTSTIDVLVSREQFNWRTDPQTQLVTDTSLQEEEDVLSFDSQRLKDPEVVCHSNSLPNSANSLDISNHSRSHSLQHNQAFGNINLDADPQFVDSKINDDLHQHTSSISVISNGYPEKLAQSSAGSDRSLEIAFLLSHVDKENSQGRIQGDVHVNNAMDTGENSIISNILSMDLDAWDDRLALPQNLAKFLGETEKEPSSLKMSGSWKGHNNNQSRFSFARQEESRNHIFDVERTFCACSQLPKSHSFSQHFTENREPLLDKIGICNGFYPSSFEEPDNFTCNPSAFPANKLSASISQISAPPGFSVPSRTPPPGFSSHERVHQSFDSMSGNHLLDSSSLLRNKYQTLPAGNLGSTGDIEFMDPAILAVGKGRLQSGLNNPSLDMWSNFPSRLNAFENEARLQLMMETSLSPHQNLRHANIGDSFSSLGDSYGISPRLMDQSQVNNLSPFAQLSMQPSRNALISNGHWEGWNEVQGGNSLGVADLLRNERLGFNKFYSGYEDSKFRKPSSGDLYNRTFGM